ncbi:beta-lactamase class A [Geomicrobium halophilum]|uniref:Beta-lactamase class A n=1 Tax=Geomicrobium halophilum TaxID=549000 RepID=A0A841PRS8_9BACL|nr:serine hydrolase [Geomicrobium halophilum]MBB6449866.1 beta-lactamase class A [Geomicrobium halophilum]
MVHVNDQLHTLLSEKNVGLAIYGIGIHHVEKNESFYMNGNELFQQASIFKIPILLSLLRQVDSNIIHLSNTITLSHKDVVPGSGVLKDLDYGITLTIKDLATLMIIVSDNMATDQIINLVGLEQIQQDLIDWELNDTHIVLNTYELLCSSVGLSPDSYNDKLIYRLDIKAFDHESPVFQTETRTNTTTPRDMNNLLKKLVSGEILTEKNTAIALDILGRQQLNHRIPALLENDVKVMHKTGSLGPVINDTGILALPEHRSTLILSLFSKGNTSTLSAERALSTISRLFVDDYL